MLLLQRTGNGFALCLQVLGDFELREAGDCHILLDERQGRRTSVLKFLACRRGRRTSTAEAAEALWPGSQPDAARSNLRVAISKLKAHLRQTNQALPVETSGRFLKLDETALSVDAWLAEDRATAVLADPSTTLGEVTDALCMIGRELLPADAYAEWASEYRQHLDRLRRSLMARAITLLRSIDTDLRVSRIVDRFAYDLVLAAPDDPEFVPEFVDYLAEKHRFVEAVQVGRTFVEHDGDPQLLPRIVQHERSAPAESTVSASPRSSWTARSSGNTGAYRAEVASIGDALDLALDGVGQAVVLSSSDEAARNCVAEEIITEAEDRGALICDIVPTDGPFLHRCAAALERLCSSFTVSSEGNARLDRVTREVGAMCERIRLAPSAADSSLSGRLLFAISQIAQETNVLISIDDVEELDSEGTGFLSQLLLVARWHRLFVLMRARHPDGGGSNVEPLFESIRGSVQFLELEDLGLSA